MRSKAILAILAALPAALPSQSNTVTGLDGRLSMIDSLSYWGRRGAPHPNGEIGMAMMNEMCNPGSVEIPWYAAMQPDHPKFGFIITRESNGRMVQINNWSSYCKHAFTSINYSGPCGSCAGSSQGGARMGIRCADAYGAGNNGDPYWLGPPEEIDPWLGTWNPVGSYFDRGDPDVGSPGNRDGNRSLTRSQTNAFDQVKNRITVQEPDLNVAGARYFYGIQLIHQGEAAANRGDNLASRGFNPTWNGSTWNLANNNIGMVYGSILQHWQGATLDGARNGNDDGTFFVAVKTTGPVNNLFHYEYAVHNFDNSRGGATLRIPLCSSSVVSNVGFRDIDGNALNEWTWSRQGNELVFQAPATNPLNWNQIFNFWFDCNSAPAPGQVKIDEARLGPGALFVAVNSNVPGGVARTVDLGPGCGSPAPTISSISPSTIPQPSFLMTFASTPNAALFVFNATAEANIPLGGGCVQYLDNQSLSTTGFFLTSATGLAVLPLPIPNNPNLEGIELNWQAVQIQNGGPVAGLFTLSNGYKVRVGNNLTCP